MKFNHKSAKRVGLEITGKAPLSSPCRGCHNEFEDKEECSKLCLFLCAFERVLASEVSLIGTSTELIENEAP